LPRNPEADGLLGYAQAANGNTAAAYRILEDLSHRSDIEYTSTYAIALVYLGLGDRDEALDWFAKAYERRSVGFVHANVDPLFDPIRSDPRFVTLIGKLGLVQLQAQGLPGGSQESSILTPAP
jgi:tetratricopeptide (TPR) repeat protein